jgi:hypothetical protein
MSLARLWQQQGKRAEAYELLAQIYGWFTQIPPDLVVKTQAIDIVEGIV